MTTRRLDVSDTTDPAASEVSAAGTVTNHIRMEFDDTKSKAEIVLAAQRGIETIIRYFDDKGVLAGVGKPDLTV